MACSNGSGVKFSRIANFPTLLYHTSQPIQALEHPKFKEMIDITSRATNSIKIPGRKATRGEIISLFKDHLIRLKAKLNVRPVLCRRRSFLTIFRVRMSKAKSA